MSIILDDILIVQREHYTIADKPAGMSIIPDKTSKGDSLLSRLQILHGHLVHPITRLDKVVSGLCLFAHSADAAATYTKQLQSQQIKKEYIAIVEGKPSKAEDTLIHHLKKQGSKTKIVSEDAPEAKRAELSYETLLQTDNYTILKIQLITGRFHQIRAQLSAAGHPIKGDVKYGARRKNADRSIHLHAYSMTLPDTDETHIAPIQTNDTLWQLAADALK